MPCRGETAKVDKPPTKKTVKRTRGPRKRKGAKRQTTKKKATTTTLGGWINMGLRKTRGKKSLH